MLLSDEEIEAMFAKASDGYVGVMQNDVKFARAIEAATLAKLASAELPELPEPSEMDGARWGYTSDDMRNYAVDAYAQGAASQLAEKPSGYLSQHNLEMLQQGYPQTIVMLEGAKRDVPLYTRRQA